MGLEMGKGSPSISINQQKDCPLSFVSPTKKGGNRNVFLIDETVKKINPPVNDDPKVELLKDQAK